MSWLFSVVLAGLMFSSASDTVSNGNEVYINNNNNTTTVILADETERFVQSYPLSANGRVSVSNINGSITVEAWDKNEVKLEAVKTADSKETLAEVEIRIDAKPDYFCVEADYGNWKNRGPKGDWRQGKRMEVEFRLTVPRGAILNEIETVNGSVTVSNFTNQTKVSAVNGQVTATNLRGAANLSTVNGTVTADFDRLEPGTRISLETVNGQVDLAVPSDSNATFRADSVNGNITNDFGLRVRKGKYVGRDLYSKVGTGDVQVKLSSVNGGLTIGRKKDGKNPGPVVDLLPQKDKDDADWDDDDDTDDDKDNEGRAARVNIDSDKMNKHIDKEIKNAHKELEKGLKEAERAIQGIPSDLPKIDVEAIQRAVESVKINEIEARVREGIDRRREGLARVRTTNWEGRTPVTEKKSNSFNVKGVPRVTIDAKGCGIKVSGWDKQEVRYLVTKISSTRTQTPIELKELQTESGVSLTVVNKDPDANEGVFLDDMNRIRVEVFVPKKSNLRIVTNGEIRLEGVTGEIDLSGADEAINVRDSGGKLHLAAGDGRVRIIGFTGDLDSQTVDGEVFLEGKFDKLSARANDGVIVLTLPEDASASLLSNTEVEGDGVALTQVNEKNWQLGKGGAKYTFAFTDGRLIVRGKSMIESN